jgi:UDP-glucose 4-epimerase
VQLVRQQAIDVDVLIHFACLKALGESVAKPLEDYDKNVSGSVVLFEEVVCANVKTPYFATIFAP